MVFFTPGLRLDTPAVKFGVYALCYYSGLPFFLDGYDDTDYL